MVTDIFVLRLLASILRQNPSGLVVEVASGSGQHAAHLAAQLSPALTWQPTEQDTRTFASIAAYTKDLVNVKQPLVVDAAASCWAEELEEQAGQVG